MKHKIIKIIRFAVLVVFVVTLMLHFYDMHNGNVESISVYDELAYTGVFEGAFEKCMQDFFQNNNIERQVEPVTTPQQAKRIAQKIIYERYGLKSVLSYRPYDVYHDDEVKMWYVYSEPIIQKIFPFVFGACSCVIVRDDGYILAAIMW